MQSGRETPVLIAGGGPVGLSLAIELGLRGIECLLVEKRDGRVTVPKMSGVTPRGMEFCRKWKIADQVRAAGIPDDHSGDLVYMTNMVGRELARWVIPPARDMSNRGYTPEPPCKCAQIYFDPILAKFAADLPSVTIRYHTELESFSQDASGVEARLVSMQTGTSETIRARFLVGCDGPTGVVRPALGIQLDGQGVVAQSVNIFFRSAELATMHQKGWAHVYRPIDQTGCWSELVPIDGRELWRLTLFDDPDGVQFAEERLRRFVGADFPHEILSVLQWDRRDHVAHQYGAGRVFIAGDSAHECSPTGGLGMHTGVEEAVNLAWKLAAMLQGWGGPRLLESYEAERRPIAVRNVELATRSFHSIQAIPGWIGDDSTDRTSWQNELQESTGRYVVGEFLKMQYCYEESPICVQDGTPPVPQDQRSYTASARPGTRAPHIWLKPGQSILDLFGFDFTLLRMGPDAPSCVALLKAAAARGMPVTTSNLPDPAVATLYEAKLALIRPDGHVAWRANACPADVETIVDRIRGTH